jgi:hypothetical protein
MKKIISMLSATFLLVAMFAGVASAESRTIKLRYGGEQMRGSNTLFLKQKIRDQRPGMDLKKFKLKSVTLVAKSLFGNGTASLQVGQKHTRSKTIGGKPRDFFIDIPSKFFKINLKVPKQNKKGGVWQIHLMGMIKVKKVIVEVVKNGTKKLLISMQNEKFIGSNTIFVKREIKSKYPHIDLSKAKLKHILLVAKSKRGRGTAQLKVGHSLGYEETIDGMPSKFLSNMPHTFDKVMLVNDSHFSKGVWQILLEGKIKVKQMVVIIKK